MSVSQKGDSHDAGNKKASGKDRIGEKKNRKTRPGEVGRALRTVYDDTLREPVPGDFLDLLGKLN